MMYPSAQSVTPTNDYCLKIVFDSGENRMLDMKPYLDWGVFRKLKNEDAFKKVRIAFDTVEWETGADLDPEFIYQKSTLKQ